jgi:hypothetical protein
MLARIDERTQQTSRVVDEIKGKLEHNYVSQEEFKPVKTIVFGLVGVILMAVVGALVALVLRKP